MGISDRINGWVEDRAVAWGGRLGSWLLGAIAQGATKALEDMEPGAIDAFKDALVKARDNPLTPPEMKVFYDKALTPGNWFVHFIAGATIAIGAIPALLGAGVPLGNLIRYIQDEQMKSYRLDPMSVITAWRRDPEKYAVYFNDLRDQGWSPERIEALKFVTLFYPAPADLVRWQAREVFEPEMVQRYGLDDEYGAIEKEPFYRAGMTDEQILNYWRAHWEHASWNQVVEMVRRGQMTEDDVWDWFRVVEIPPFWRDKLIAISWEVPTRVDVRRFWDMRTIDEARLREIYTAQGYHGKDLEDYVLWTKIYVDFPDLITRFKNGWLTLDEVRAELIKLGMSPDRAEELIQTKVKAAASEKMAKDRDLTAAEIVKGVKKEVITWEQGIELLMELGYDEWEAEFKLMIDVAVEAGSPESYSEFKDITRRYREMVTPEAKRQPEELKRAAAEVVRLTRDVEALQSALAEEEKGLLDTEVLPPEATARRDELRVTRNRAISELERVRAEYTRLLAEWKHTPQA